MTEADPKGQGFVVANFPSGTDLRDELAYMSSYAENDPQVDAIHTLAKNFVTCDRWFASMPGPTVPNRFFVHAATSGGYAGTSYLLWRFTKETGGDWVTDTETVPENLISIFEVLQSNNKSWGIYYMDHSLQLPSQVRYWSKQF